MATAATARWERVAETLTVAGIPATVTHGQRIHIKTAGGHIATIRDTWWNKNPDIWLGYQVELAGPDDITVKIWPKTKKRSEVQAAVRQALELAATREK